jgi:D-sedoheptulose 7-phosphate isomerase
VTRFARPLPAGRRHLDELTRPLGDLRRQAPRLESWGRRLAEVLTAGGRLLAAGNGGSAAQAAHLTAELVGRYRDDRPPFSAIALCTDASAVTAIGNDYGIEEVFARQVRGHGRPGDMLLALSTSGESANVLAAVEAARACGMTTWALCGRRGSPLAARCDDALCVESPYTATVQEIHLIAVHLVCAAVDEALGLGPAAAAHGGAAA